MYISRAPDVSAAAASRLQARGRPGMLGRARIPTTASADQPRPPTVNELLRGAQRAMRRLQSTPLHPQWHAYRGSAAKLRMLAREASGRVLDLGAADGWARAHVPGASDYVSLDYPATAVALYGVRPDIFGTATCLPFRDASFATVLLLDVLEHVPDPESALAEVARVLAPGGRLLLTVPFLYPIHDDPYDFQRYTRNGLKVVLERAGLRVAATAVARPRGGNRGTRGQPCACPRACSMPRASAGSTPSPGCCCRCGCRLCNLLSWCVARVAPDDGFMPLGYTVVATKP